MKDSPCASLETDKTESVCASISTVGLLVTRSNIFMRPSKELIVGTLTHN